MKKIEVDYGDGSVGGGWPHHGLLPSPSLSSPSLTMIAELRLRDHTSKLLNSTRIVFNVFLFAFCRWVYTLFLLSI